VKQSLWPDTNSWVFWKKKKTVKHAVDSGHNKKVSPAKTKNLNVVIAVMVRTYRLYRVIRVTHLASLSNWLQSPPPHPPSASPGRMHCITQWPLSDSFLSLCVSLRYSLTLAEGGAGYNKVQWRQNSKGLFRYPSMLFKCSEVIKYITIMLKKDWLI
jgi:hypothetical protein